MFTISITEKGGRKRLVECTKSVVTIGRLQGNDIVLPLGNVSKKHAQIEQANNEFTVTDIGSTNGTYVNGRKITAPATLESGDKIYVGEFIVSVNPAENDEPSSPDVPVLSGRPTIPPPIPKKARKSIPPRTGGKVAPPVIEDNEDTLTSIDESKFPEIKSAFKRSTPSAAPQAGNDKEPPRRDSIPLPIAAPVEQLIDFVAIEERKIDRANLPSVTDPSMAARVRQILNLMIARLDAEGQLPEGYTAGSLFMEAFLSIVNLGPLSTILTDTQVREVRINSIRNIHVLADGVYQPFSKQFQSDTWLVRVLECLTAGLQSGSADLRSDGMFRLENGDLVVWHAGVGTLAPVAMIYRAIEKVSLNPAVLSPIRAVMEEGGSIAISGSHPLVKLQMIEEMLGDHSEERIIAVARRPLLHLKSGEHLAFNAPSVPERLSPIEALLGDVAAFRANRLVVRAQRWGDVPAILRVAAGSTPLIAELPPLGGRDLNQALERGLFGLATGNPSVEDTFASVFDLLVICSGEASTGLVEKILRVEKRVNSPLKLVPVFESSL